VQKRRQIDNESDTINNNSNQLKIIRPPSLPTTPQATVESAQRFPWRDNQSHQIHSNCIAHDIIIIIVVVAYHSKSSPSLVIARHDVIRLMVTGIQRQRYRKRNTTATANSTNNNQNLAKPPSHDRISPALLVGSNNTI